MPYVPRHQAQLGAGVPVPHRTRGSRDCGPRSWSMGADKRSRGRVRPGVRKLRRRGHVIGPQPTSIDDARLALDGLPVPGRTPLRLYRKRRVADARRAVRLGRPVILAISYRAWNRIMHGDTGDPHFMGAHSVTVVEERRRGAGVEWLLGDSLDDGRREGIPRGFRWVRRRDVIAAAVALAEGDRNAIWVGVIGGANRV